MPENKKNKRDDFTATTKRNLAGQAGYCCSCPDCRIFTIGPNASTETPSLIGEAAHITAAAPGGARYNPKLTSDERKSYSNGIWLCCTCARKIDVDPETYPVELLQEWKEAASIFAREQMGSIPWTTSYTSFAAPYLKLDTDNRFRYFGGTISFQAEIISDKIDGAIKVTTIDLTVEGDVDEGYFTSLGTLAVKVYLQAHLTDPRYIQIFMTMRERHLKSLSMYVPIEPSLQENSDNFRKHMVSMDWSNSDYQDGDVFDAVAGSIDGEWNAFLFNLTKFHHQEAH